MSKEWEGSKGYCSNSAIVIARCSSTTDTILPYFPACAVDGAPDPGCDRGDAVAEVSQERGERAGRNILGSAWDLPGVASGTPSGTVGVVETSLGALSYKIIVIGMNGVMNGIVSGSCETFRVMSYASVTAQVRSQIPLSSTSSIRGVPNRRHGNNLDGLLPIVIKRSTLPSPLNARPIPSRHRVKALQGSKKASSSPLFLQVCIVVFEYLNPWPPKKQVCRHAGISTM